MNKLLVSDIIKLDSGSYTINCTKDELEITINGQVTIYLINEKLHKLYLNLQDKSELRIYKYNNLKGNNLEVDISQNNNSKLYYNESFINQNNNYLKINNYLKGNNNESNINVRNVCNDKESEIVINVYVDKYTRNNIALEDLKGINNGGFIHIEPNIICESNEVVANHLTTIGSLEQNSLNYLMAKGINEEKAKELLLNGFVYSNMDDYVKEIGR